MNTKQKIDRNEDPITGEPGSHPVGVGVGTAGGAAAGAALGAIGGPVGAIVGAVAGGVAGAYTGKSVAEAIDPTEQANYWRENHSNQVWASNDKSYDDFEPAYRMGYETAALRRSRWDDSGDKLENEWEEFKGDSKLKWHEAKDAVRAGWHRVENRLPGDADGDG
ncbi:MAG: hypothetical protein H7Y36_00580, partial [Armatimonadetes bacterium]|nr:hypothetical protein [Akkermansiaceae bacterium]